MKRSFLAVLLSFTLFTGCAQISVPTNANLAFEKFTYQLFQQDVQTSTIGLHYTLQHPGEYGIQEYPITFGTFETDYVSSMASLENCQAVLEKFVYSSLTRENQLTFDVLTSYLELAEEGLAYEWYEEPLSPVTGVHAQIPILLAEYQFHDAEDIDTYLQLLDTFPDYIQSLIQFETRKSKKGLFMSDSIANEVISQCNAFLEMSDSNYLYSTFETRLDAMTDSTTPANTGSIATLSSSQKETYLEKNRRIVHEKILPAYETLVGALEKLKGSGRNDNGLCFFPEGKDYYQYLIRKETGSSHSVSEIEKLIKTQIASDLLLAQETISENPDLTSQATVMSSPPEKLLDLLRQKIHYGFPDTEKVSVQVKYVPDALEPYLSPAFYLVPAIDNYSENVIYINQLHSLNDIHLFTTLAHEGYPGHLYQTTYFASRNPNPLRTLFSFKGYTEGWATYAEMCSYYLSPLEKPLATLMQTNSSLILGLYALADLGIHYDGWDLDRTREFFSTYGIDDENTIQQIYQLISGDPANYLSYYLGYLEILCLKKDMIEKKGQGFSQLEFHENLLNIGPAPFDVVRKYMELPQLGT